MISAAAIGHRPTSTTALSNRANRGTGGGYLLCQESVNFEFLLIAHVRIEHGARYAPLSALRGAHALFLQLLLVTPVKVVQADVDVWIFVRVVL